MIAGNLEIEVPCTLPAGLGIAARRLEVGSEAGDA